MSFLTNFAFFLETWMLQRVLWSRLHAMPRGIFQSMLWPGQCKCGGTFCIAMSRCISVVGECSLRQVQFRVCAPGINPQRWLRRSREKGTHLVRIRSWLLGTALAVWDLVLLPPLFKVLFVTVSIKVSLMDISALAFLWVSITLVFSFPSSAVMAFKGMGTVTALKVSKAQPVTFVQTQTSTARTVMKVSNSDGEPKGEFRTKIMVQIPVYWIPFWQDQHH